MFLLLLCAPAFSESLGNQVVESVATSINQTQRISYDEVYKNVEQYLAKKRFYKGAPTLEYPVNKATTELLVNNYPESQWMNQKLYVDLAKQAIAQMGPEHPLIKPFVIARQEREARIQANRQALSNGMALGLGLLGGAVMLDNATRPVSQPVRNWNCNNYGATSSCYGY